MSTPERAPDPADLIDLPTYCERFGVTLPSARRHVRDVPGLAWRVMGKVRIDPAAAAELHRPKPAWRGGEAGPPPKAPRKPARARA